MNFYLDPEQQQFKESAERFFREQAGFDRWRKCTESDAPFDRACWADMSNFGWLALNLPESAGGVGAPPVYTHLLMEQAGRALSREPLVGTCVVAASLLPHMAEPLRSELAVAIAEGKSVVALAHAELEARFDLANVQTWAHEAVGGFMLQGMKSHVPDGAAADWFIVPARTSGSPRDPFGISLYLVRATSAGLTRHSLRGADYRHNARIRLDNVYAGAETLIGEVGQGLVLLEQAVDLALVAGVAEAVGIMEALRDATLDYIKTREQFGRRIGSFQVLQHRMVDMEIACQEARAMLLHASAGLEGTVAERRRAVSAAKSRLGQTSLFVGHQAVQLHGGIGTTDDLIISHYLKRLVMLESSFGNGDFHRRRFLESTPSLAVA